MKCLFDLEKLSATAEQVSARIGELTECPVVVPKWIPDLQKVQRHLKFANEYLAEIDWERPESSLFPSFKDSLEEIISRQLQGFEGGTVPPVAGADSVPPSVPPQDSAGLQGDTRCIAVPELISCLSVGCKSGMLYVMMSKEVITLWFMDGNLINAVSNHNPEGTRLGDILVSRGILKQKKLNKFLATHQNSTSRMGEALLREDVVTKEELREALHEQVQQLFHRLSTDEQATYRFHEGLSESLEHDYTLNVTHLLLESARQADES